MLTAKGRRTGTKSGTRFGEKASWVPWRIDDYKYRFIDQPAGWLGEKTKPDLHYLINLASIRSSARAGPIGTK